MEFLTEWITNIILFVLIATVIDLLLPNTNLQKYTKMVTGLLLIAIILSPVLKLLSSDFETTLASIPKTDTNEELNMENSIDFQKKEIQAFQHAYILEEMGDQLKQIAQEELIEQFGFEIASIDLIVDENSTSPENIQSITVVLKDPDKEVEAVEVVQKVEINTNEPLPLNDRTEEFQNIASLLSEKWDVEKESIQVVLEGGNS